MSFAALVDRLRGACPPLGNIVGPATVAAYLQTMGAIGLATRATRRHPIVAAAGIAHVLFSTIGGCLPSCVGEGARGAEGGVA